MFSQQAAQKSGDISVQISAFIQQLKRRELSGANNVAIDTANLLLRFISANKWTKVDTLLRDVKALGLRLEAAQPQELVCGNIVRRVLAIIREAYESPSNNNTSDQKQQQQQQQQLKPEYNLPPSSSMFELLSESNRSETFAAAQTTSKRGKNYKAEIIEGIQELIDEITNVEEAVSGFSLDMIHENEIILAATPDSRTVLKFLLRAQKKRNFAVIVTESYPNSTSEAHVFAGKLAKAGIETAVVPDTMVFALMSRVGKVIVGTRAVLANGGCVVSAGVANVCECARQYRAPVLAVTGLYKLSPLYPFDVESLIEVGDSGKVVDFEDGEMVDRVDAVNPVYDYVPPEHVDIVVSNLGGYAPSFVYRLVLDYYSPDDVNLGESV
ncbi:uncharacterized protein SAPINGB_P002571 [Magnusiomyces paraingens]|uniref:Translation initiation factor eIF2B subunit beta n=1 Tax=Magnusiomyces paraingens TaxID=2606893 RepID=A0A5E8BGQ2_9ASCO|nr:uncharacterized protein SAPINGB_P002571 [Saprochaete ingens]VVT50041.1 unnamed protein product [Saprochaete ingens]